MSFPLHDILLSDDCVLDQAERLINKNTAWERDDNGDLPIHIACKQEPKMSLKALPLVLKYDTCTDENHSMLLERAGSGNLPIHIICDLLDWTENLYLINNPITRKRKRDEPTPEEYEKDRSALFNS